MTLNPFFLQGSKGEQGLVQDLINEQLRMYGIECHYIPRKLVTSSTIMKEVTESRFDQAFPLETYLMNTDGYAGQGDILTKFGVRVTDEATFVISKERFEEAVAPFLEQDDEYTLSNRPKEGDLIFFPLGKRMFEIKFVEHEKPFYQLQKNYVYQLQCELFEYEDEVIDTNVNSIDKVVQTDGYIARLVLSGVGSVATANATLNFGAVQQIFVQNDGYGYLAAPTVSISTSPGVDATAVAIMTERSGIGTAKSIDRILLINPGGGYIGIPTVTVPGTGIATAGITTLGSVGIVTITTGGSGYTTTPNVSISTAPSGGTDATAEAVMVGGTISAIRISNAGSGYTSAPTITVGAATTIADGDYIFNETVQVSSDSSETARVKVWDSGSRTLDVSMLTKMQFQVGEKIQGLESGAEYVILSVDYDTPNDYPNDQYNANQYNDNADFETEGDSILDFSEGNPFGTF
nr:neck protein [uncultured Mediterranean phage uvMED]